MRCMISSLLLLLPLCLGPLPAAAATRDFVIGYLQLSKDARYADTRTYARFLKGALGRPLRGARVALDEVAFVGAALGLDFKLEPKMVADAESGIAAVKALHGQGVHFILLDLPGESVAQIADATRVYRSC